MSNSSNRKPLPVPFAHPFQRHDMADVATLREIMARLRDPESGCPWDVKQDFASIASYTIEEAYEVADAIARQDLAELKEELGDLLLQVVYHAQMAAEQGAFAFEDVVEAITTKLVRRHPHVFGDEDARSAASVKGLWERLKAEEHAAKLAEGAATQPESALDGVPVALPALTRAAKVQSKAARTGFDWEKPQDVSAKMREELDELDAEIGADAGHERLQDETGDILFAAVNLARHLKLDPEAALRHATDKFMRRFKAMERELNAKNKTLQDCALDEMEQVWQRVKNRR